MNNTKHEAPHYAIFSSLPSLPIFKIPQPLFTSLIVRNENAHPYKTTGKTRLPDILTLMSHGEQKYK